jgi:hypothetical protein
VVSPWLCVAARPFGRVVPLQTTSVCVHACVGAPPPRSRVSASCCIAFRMVCACVLPVLARGVVAKHRKRVRPLSCMRRQNVCCAREASHSPRGAVTMHHHPPPCSSPRCVCVMQHGTHTFRGAAANTPTVVRGPNHPSQLSADSSHYPSTPYTPTSIPFPSTTPAVFAVERHPPCDLRGPSASSSSSSTQIPPCLSCHISDCRPHGQRQGRQRARTADGRGGCAPPACRCQRRTGGRQCWRPLLVASRAAAGARGRLNAALLRDHSPRGASGAWRAALGAAAP